MATIQTNLTCELQNGSVAVQYLNGVLFTQDVQGNQINVAVYDGGEPATISGTVTANIIRSDGGTVTATGGSISGNVASIAMPSAAYAVPGVASIIVKLSTSGVVTTIAAVVANIYESSTSTAIDPGTIIPSVTALVAQIDTAVASIPADYSTLWTTLAPAFSTSTNYVAGQYVTYNGGLYRFTTAHTGTWSSSDVVAANIGNDLSDLKSILSIYEGENEKDFTNETIYNTLISSSTNKWSTSNNNKSYIFAVPTGTTSIKIKSNSTNGTPFAMLKDDSYTHGTLANYATGTGRTFVAADETKEYIVPSDCKYIWILKEVSSTSYMPQSFKFVGYQPIPAVDSTLTQDGDAADAKVTGDKIAEINGILEGTPITSEGTLTNSYFYSSGSNNVGSEATLSYSSNGKYGIFDISYAAGGSIEVETASLESSSTVMSLLCDSDHKIISKIATSNWLVLSDGVYKGRLSVPVNAQYLQYSVYKGSATITLSQTHKPISDSESVLYVSTSGSDDNDGESIATAKATVTAALNAGAKTVLVGGGIYEQQIDLSGAKGDIRIAPAVKDGLPVFVAPDSLITTEETAVSGTTKVYSAECTKTFDSKIVWIFQDGIPDADTEITAADRHPLSRGKQYRCGDTKIVKCSANNTADAITEIENASVYKWYLDDANDTIYFSRPQSVSANNPIRTSFGSALFNNLSRVDFLNITGICVKYMYMNIGWCANAILSDCECHNAMAEGGFRWGRGVGIKLYKCEASRIFYSTTSGDGFNAHSNNTGDAFAHQTSCMLFDCWGHDCCDDGYSDHERCEISIYGGLFENNGGGGVTPAQGSHCTCYNVLSRYNGEADFFYTGNPSVDEGGVGGQIACFNCVSKGSGTGKGFRLNGSAVQGLFVNCVCMNRDTAFYSERNGGTQVGTLINCSTVDCTTQKSSIYTVKTGTPVT